LRHGVTRIEIERLNDLLGLIDGVRVIGAQVANENELILFLIGDGLPEPPGKHHHMPPETDLDTLRK
jgi:hypothetical protein